MSPAEIHEFVANAKKTITKPKGGPRTDAGRWRSAVNAVRHGLVARHLLLPGEDVAAYEQKMDEIFSALSPTNAAEAELVALVADDLHRLDRLARVEKGITLGRIEELLKLTGAGEKSASTVSGLSALGSALTEWAAPPLPTKRDREFTRRFEAMVNAVTFVEATVPGVPASLIEACEGALDALQGEKDDAISGEGYAKAFDAARALLTFLLDKGKAEDAEQDELRAAISNIALPDKTELAKLAKYRSMLETSLQRRLAALEQVRRLSVERRESGADADKAREYRVRLRVVA